MKNPSKSPLLAKYLKGLASLEPDLLCPEILAWNTRDFQTLWKTALKADPLAAVPYWGIVWPGGRALARYILDNKHLISGRRVLEIGSGSGIASIAAAKAGAHVTGMDRDPLAVELAGITAEANGVKCGFLAVSPLDCSVEDLSSYSVIMAGDIFNDKSFAEGAIRLLRNASRRGLTTIASDGGHDYIPREGISILCSLRVPVYKEIEGISFRDVKIFKFN